MDTDRNQIIKRENYCLQAKQQGEGAIYREREQVKKITKQNKERRIENVMEMVGEFEFVQENNCRKMLKSLYTTYR